MTGYSPPSNLSNPLATIEQLSTSTSQLDGIPADLELSVRFVGARLTQAAGILLRLPQDTVAQAIVIFYRFWIGAGGGSLKDHDAKDVSAAALYMMAKLSPYPQTPRNVLNVYSYLLSDSSNLLSPADSKTRDPEAYYLSEGTYYSQRTQLFQTERKLAFAMGLQTHVALPYTIAINYLQALDTFGQPKSNALAQRTFAHLNTALLSPQMLYLTHQPPALATAAIYLAARELDIKLPDDNWWEAFDTDREELGFLVVGMRSVEGFAVSEKEKWGRRSVPLTVEAIDAELEARRMLENGE
ncbi:hypothetical protein L228DRAFT_261042 [Xylona heveae TC161]|uniref:Cyclin domain-containing protein n=1 Tax=Xylona heveae (strain CBS 132557 / TC161) TaxID=1328760 RepID=A0A165H381_XYLHT|nr:hypothetical protein L228DRAFT_261042 [Xylona heveae TC161]KZF22924.1 hypothetical protein L228DRAFT_261042 [Xylona heveae TC161]